MNIKKLIIVLSAVVVFVASAFTVYFMFENSFKITDSDALAAGVSTTGNLDTTLVSEKTGIVKRIRYTKGVPVVLETLEEAGPENLGMDRKTALEHYKQQGFLIVEFSAARVVMIKEMAQWPPNYYIVKEEEGVVNTYFSDGDGKLSFLKSSELEIETIPSGDQNDLKQGLAFKTLQEIDNMLEEYDS